MTTITTTDETMSGDLVLGCKGPRQETFLHLHACVDADVSKPDGEPTHLVVGIDEAGRGPVLGPMVYAAAFHVVGSEKEFAALGFADSKVLTPAARETLVTSLASRTDAGFCVQSISAADVAARMLVHRHRAALARDPQRACGRGSGGGSLNDVALDATAAVLRAVLARGNVVIDSLFVDTLGAPDRHERALRGLFPNITRITVAKRADSLYPSVSAASVCAKVARDAVLSRWNEPRVAQHWTQLATGSGYPSDPATVHWLRANVDPIFAYGSIARYSWATADKALVTASAVPIAISDPLLDEQIAAEEKQSFPGKRQRSPSRNHQRSMLEMLNPPSLRLPPPIFSSMRRITTTAQCS